MDVKKKKSYEGRYLPDFIWNHCNNNEIYHFYSFRQVIFFLSSCRAHLYAASLVLIFEFSHQLPLQVLTKPNLVHRWARVDDHQPYVWNQDSLDSPVKKTRKSYISPTKSCGQHNHMKRGVHTDPLRLLSRLSHHCFGSSRSSLQELILESSLLFTSAEKWVSPHFEIGIKNIISNNILNILTRPIHPSTKTEFSMHMVSTSQAFLTEFCNQILFSQASFWPIWELNHNTEFHRVELLFDQYGSWIINIKFYQVKLLFDQYGSWIINTKY